MTQSRTQSSTFLHGYTWILVWLLIYVTMILLASRNLELIPCFVSTTCTFVPMVIVWTVLRFVLLPHLYHEKRWRFFITLTFFISVLMILATFNDQYFIHVLYVDKGYKAPEQIRVAIANDGEEMSFLHMKYTFLLLCTSTIEILRYLMNERKSQLEAFKEQQMQEELKYLRAQINPHFLFNALNCIYALTMTQDENAPDSVLKLSEMLRYVIDDCQADRVSLQKELRYIRNYIDFQRIRMEREPDLSFEVQVTDPNYQIPPMILQPMIENCFKHSRLVDNPKAWIHITLRQNDSGLLFTTDNSIPPEHQFCHSITSERKDEERTGIGLQNVQQRLEMIFGDKCSLKVIEDDTHYKTVMHIS